MAFAGLPSTSVVKTESRRAGLKRHHCHLPSANVTAVSHAILGLQGVQGQDFIVSDPVAIASWLDEQNELTQPDLGFPGLLQQALPCPSSPQASLSGAFSGPLSSWANSFGCWKIPDPYSQAHLPSVPATCASCLSGVHRCLAQLVSTLTTAARLKSIGPLRVSATHQSEGQSSQQRPRSARGLQ